MKIPNKVKIKGHWWKVKSCKSGGEFRYKDRTISVDMKSTEKESILLHEIMEVLFEEERLRFSGTTDNHYRFFMNHDDFTRYCDGLYAIMKDNKFIS